MGENKDDNAADAVRSYIGGLTKREKAQIIKELEEEEGDSEEESPRFYFKNIRFVPVTPSNVVYTFDSRLWVSPWSERDTKNEVEADVQDVSFEE